MILGLIIQTNSGIPIYHEIYSNKIIEFSKDKTDNLLTSGFLNAIISFAGEYNQDLDFIRFIPRKSRKQVFNSLVGKIHELTFFCFTDPYVFPNEVLRKIQWLYDYVFSKYIKDIQTSKVPKLTEIDYIYIKDILSDSFLKQRININKEEIQLAIRRVNVELQEELIEFAICSFDNNILYQNNNDEINKQDLEYMLFDFGKGGLLESQEIQFKPVWFPDKVRDPLLLSVANSGITTSFNEISGISIDGDLPYFYYVVTEMESSIGPIMNRIMFAINRILLTY